jgi:hypothetical protein
METTMYTHSELTRTASTHGQSHWTAKSTLLAAAAALALSGSSTFAADKPTLAAPYQPGYATVGPNTGHHSPFKVTYGVLVSQMNQGSNFGYGIDSQNFSATDSVYDDAGADDFVIPNMQFWNVTEVDAGGVYYNGAGPATSFNVFFYRNSNKGNVPGRQVAACQQAPYWIDKITGATRIPFNPRYCSGVDYRGDPGPYTYWVSIVANCNYADCGQWGWVENRTIRGNPAKWQNPGGGFGTPCTTWGVNATCLGSSIYSGDYAFALIGNRVQFPSHGRAGFQFGKGK